MESFIIRTPCSSANVGPGFDVIGLALSIYLELHVRVDRMKTTSQYPLNCRITYDDEDGRIGETSLDPRHNLITQSALYVLRCHNESRFPFETHVHINNRIPLRKGLGGSGSAVVAGAVLAREVGRLEQLDDDRLLDFCLMIERHPDNVGPALFGGLVGSFLKPLSPAGTVEPYITMSEMMDSLTQEDMGKNLPIPPRGIAYHIKYPLAREIRAVAVVPDFEVPTYHARTILPESYHQTDIVFNLQRLALLPVALGQSPPDPELICCAIQDRLHQPFRQALVPGLDEFADSLCPATTPGFLGLYLSGAGPTILALATENFEMIANKIISVLRKVDKDKYASCKWMVLEPADGVRVVRE